MPTEQPIILIPLDERPVNTKYPQMLGAIAGASVLIPPAEILGFARTPADLPAVLEWVREQVIGGASAIIASCDFLGYGNLINARISQDSAFDALARLNQLGSFNHLCPVHAFSLITRVANANDCVEEPLYWGEWGTRFYRYANLTHRAEAGAITADEQAELDSLTATIPADLRADWMTRRLRNHAVNLGLLDMTARGRLSSLLLTSDDTAPYGFSTRERDWLLGWRKLVGEPLSGRVQAYPGADEVGSALVARTINQSRNRQPRVWIEYAIPADREIVAPYEDRPVEQTVLGQIAACGCVVAESVEESDFVLGVVTPSPNRTDYRKEFYGPDCKTRGTPYRSFIDLLANHQLGGHPIALADVAYPNGGDRLFSRILFDLSPPHKLRPSMFVAYGAWNTAGNTLGVVIAEASLAIYAETDDERNAAKLFLTHRILEDMVYQTFVRGEARDEAERLWGTREPSPTCMASQHEVAMFVEGNLQGWLSDLRFEGIGAGVEIVPASTRLPWRRTFEVDFDLRLVADVDD
ncbi:MAG TPA: DUF4127 family protein [Capsulimonadaceae bacterium]|jgi:hypothetical protein